MVIACANFSEFPIKKVFPLFSNRHLYEEVVMTKWTVTFADRPHLGTCPDRMGCMPSVALANRPAAPSVPWARSITIHVSQKAKPERGKTKRFFASVTQPNWISTDRIFPTLADSSTEPSMASPITTRRSIGWQSIFFHYWERYSVSIGSRWIKAG